MVGISAGWQRSALGRQVAGGVSVAVMALLLNACGALPGAQPGQAPDAANGAQTADKRGRSVERPGASWPGVKGERFTARPRKGVRPSPLDDLLDEPDYALSVRQIMANAACRGCDELPYHEMVVNASNRHGVPTSLIHAVIQKESAYNPAATSGRRARGLMQVTPEAARSVGFGNARQLYDPQTNIYAGTAYLKYLLGSHATVDEALAAYNSGPGNVRKYRGVPPFKETRRYVRDVKRAYFDTAR
ncbi:lytic transglycosylase domain-containing protein [Noviherbaspirillum galbum]|uniref:Lytic transglycosylase domain-containing protein n=1 Tax=Noviherbaspirillum galbum TaxID=2709383 RepID=A0A6B3SFR8_9BURK|nr:lytic transglycosylase domain-containing protein [Noviherbaspirillum galbum]NEX59498.1 lytic transglycosylase domain-containing protein [Noviherbaspirillum galbum]